MIKNISTAIASAACFAALTATASAATNPIGRAADGALNAGEDIINGVANAGDDIVNGITGGRTNGTDNTNGANNGTTSNPAVSDIPDVSDITDTSDISGTTSDVNANQSPATGVSFGLTAAAAMLGALGVVVTANRRGE